MKRNWIRIISFSSLTLVYLIVSLSASYFLFQYKNDTLQDYRSILDSLLSTTRKGLNSWIKEKQAYLSHVGRDRELVSLTEDLLKVPRNPRTLLASRELARVRRFFSERRDAFGETGFFLITPDGISIGSRRDSNVGTVNVIYAKSPERFARVMKGETLFIPPIPSDVAVADSWTTMFMLTPVRTGDDRIIAALSQRLLPRDDFSLITTLGRFGQSGETYLFDRNGTLLSESRFDDQLKRVGLIESDKKAIFNLQIRDPGGDLTRGYRSELPRDKQPLTLMAREAIRNGAGGDMEGYRDYRGVEVFGSWYWDDTLDLGITAEVDTNEALKGYRRLRIILISVLSLAFLLMFAALYLTLTIAERTNRTLDRRVRKRTAQLAEARDAAEQALKVKSAFLANMSHEIRTPMNVTLGFLELVLETDLDPPTRRHLETARDSARSLLGIINDILDISKVEAGRIQVESICFSLRDLMEEMNRIFGQEARKKELNLEILIQPGVNETILGDPTLLRQVLVNLIGNAIKFTKQGSVRVEVIKEREEYLHFFIHDTGIGMTPRQIGVIFEPFVQADQSTVRRFGGTGLGTTISRQIVNLMGGEIDVVSEPGTGSTFHFTMPLLREDCTPILSVAETEKKERHPAPPLAQSRPLHVLLCEDLPDNATLVNLRLKGMGHTMVWATNGREAVEMYRTGKFDIILMDVQMPEMDGLEATRRIRELEGDRDYHTPIIALTASIMDEESRACYEAGMDAIEGKPIHFSDLQARMNELTTKYGSSGT